MKRRNKFGLIDGINIILYIGMLVLGALVSYGIIRYSFLNFRGLNIVVLGVLAVVVLGSIFLIIKRSFKVFNTIILLLMNAVLLFTYFNFRQAINLFDEFNTTAAVNEYTMSVVVPKDSEINNIKQLGDKEVLAPVSSDGESINKLAADIRSKEKSSINLKESTTYMDAYEEMLAGKNEAMILNSSYESLITAKYSDFNDKVKKIYEFKITKKIDVKANNTGDVFNVYISGIDTYGPISSVSRSDVNIIMTVNMKTNKILLTTTPRDSYVKIADGGNNQYDKLTHAGIYGVDASIHTLENLYNIKLDYYARLNFTSFLNLIDLIGGVDVYNDQEFTSLHGKYHFNVGMVHLDADKALGFVRERYSLVGGDNDRGKNQEKVIAAIIKKLSSKEALSNYRQVITELSKSIQTNMPLETVMGLANKQLSAEKDYAVSSQALTGHGTMGLPSYAMPGSNLYMTQIDEKSLTEVKENISQVLEGK